MKNIPIYRAKKKYGDKVYIEGDLLNYDGHYMIIEDFDKYYTCDGQNIDFNYELVDKSTLAIHFPDMMDCKGTRIFASLNEDGKGGDEIIRVGYHDTREVVTCDKEGTISTYMFMWTDLKNLRPKVIGVME